MSGRYVLDGVETRSPLMRATIDRTIHFARFNRSLVFIGPVGSGKTMLAAMAYRAMNLRGPFVQVSSGSVTADLYSDFLVGHVAGAWTGAIKSTPGALAAAANGVLFLDDLAQLPKPGQAALLRVLDQRLYRMSGRMTEERVACRFMFASTDTPSALLNDGWMLRDFAERLGGFVIEVPRLADRADDIIPLAQRAAEGFLDEHGLNPRVRFEQETIRLLLANEWPGNVRQLKGVIEYATALALVDAGVTVVRPAHLPAALRGAGAVSNNRARLETELIRRTVHAVGGNQSKAARILGFHRNTIRRHLEREG